MSNLIPGNQKHLTLNDRLYIEHTLLRMILPKGTLFTDLTQWDVRRIVNHMNSYARKNLEGATPYQLALKKYGPEILEALQIKFIPPDEVTMSPDLLKK